MTCLLDTHTLICSLLWPDKLPGKVVSSLEDQGNAILVSAISFWEISLKYSLGKLDLQGIYPHEIPHHAGEAGFGLLHLSPEEASTYHELPGTWHGDPFDRMLIWQAMRQDMVLVTGDADIWKYRQEGLKLLW
ncbi:MAG: type II toxin-antitoxin system VapC family toxin [Balneolaceae bacterium]|nr:type II toxin-antitoxin system VapC family toxin [Balneolaceae bacterium]